METIEAPSPNYPCSHPAIGGGRVNFKLVLIAHPNYRGDPARERDFRPVLECDSKHRCGETLRTCVHPAAKDAAEKYLS